MPYAAVWPIVLVLASACLIVSRRPDVILHATFWAEDGWIWYPAAYEQGWRSLLEPCAGYLQTDSRLVALVCQAFPLAWAPTLFAGWAIMVQAVTASFMASDRLALVCPARSVRCLFALLYLLLPNSFEVYANLTNAQWHLGLLAFLVTISRGPRRSSGWGFDLAVLTLSGLSGPLCLFIVPVAVWRAFVLKDRAAVARAGILLAGAATQLWCLFGHGVSRGAAPLGATPVRLARILSMQVVLALMLGRHSTARYLDLPWWQDGALPCLVVVVAALLAYRCLTAGPPIVRWSCLFACPALAAALVRPATGSAVPAWVLFSRPDIGDRYYMLPMLAWAVVLFALAADRNAWFRGVGRSFVAVTFVMLPGDWHLPTTFPFSGRTDFLQRAEVFARVPPGSVMTFPVHPTGAIPMALRKR